MTKSILPSLCLNSYQYFHFQTIDLTPPTTLHSFNLGNIINLLKYLDLIQTFLHFIDKLETVAGVWGQGLVPALQLTLSAQSQLSVSTLQLSPGPHSRLCAVAWAHW